MVSLFWDSREEPDKGQTLYLFLVKLLRDRYEAFAQDAMLIKRPLIVKDETAVLVGFRAKDEEIRDRLDI